MQDLMNKTIKILSTCEVYQLISTNSSKDISFLEKIAEEPAPHESWELMSGG